MPKFIPLSEIYSRIVEENTILEDESTIYDIITDIPIVIQNNSKIKIGIHFDEIINHKKLKDNITESIEEKQKKIREVICELINDKLIECQRIGVVIEGNFINNNSTITNEMIKIVLNEEKRRLEE